LAKLPDLFMSFGDPVASLFETFLFFPGSEPHLGLQPEAILLGP